MDNGWKNTDFDYYPQPLDTRPDVQNPLLHDLPEADTTEEETRKSKKREAKFDLLRMQMIICLLGLCAVIALKLVGGDVLSAAKEKYSQWFSQRVSVGEVRSTFAQVFSESVVSGESVYQPEDSLSVVSAGNTDSENFLSSLETGSSSLPENTAFILPTAAVSAAKKVSNSMTVPVSGTVTSSYGMRTDPFTGEYRFHAGTDIGAQEGSAIAAALGGVVEEAGYSESYGYYLIVASSAQLKILYGHCSSLSVEKGDTVARGSKIAEVGSTGRSTGPHLHFEIRIGDSTIDPQTVINLQ